MGIKFLPDELRVFFLLPSWAVEDGEEVELFAWGNTGVPIICQGRNLRQNQLAPEHPLFEDRDIKILTSWLLYAFVKPSFPFP